MKFLIVFILFTFQSFAASESHHVQCGPYELKIERGQITSLTYPLHTAAGAIVRTGHVHTFEDRDGKLRLMTFIGEAGERPTSSLENPRTVFYVKYSQAHSQLTAMRSKKGMWREGVDGGTLRKKRIGIDFDNYDCLAK
jgi:hypothetical protein